MSFSRRRVLMAGLLAVPAASWPRSPRARPAAGVKRIALVNLLSGEELEVEYRRDEAYLTDALAAIESLLRDFHSGERHAIDPKLMDYLVDAAAKAGAEASFNVLSGYRPAPGGGGSRPSLHMQGRAIDVRMRNVDCAKLAASARELRQGGVGYYRGSNFVHLDTGAFRTWRG